MDRRGPRGPLPNEAKAHPGHELAQVSEVGVLRAACGASEFDAIELRELARPGCGLTIKV